MAVRIQRRRTKGWRMPAGAFNVTRPGPWGNPFVLPPKADAGERNRLVAFFRECLLRAIRGFPFPAGPDGRSLSAETMARFEYMAANLFRLRGKDLCCYCPPSAPCHADVLIELANG